MTELAGSSTTDVVAPGTGPLALNLEAEIVRFYTDSPQRDALLAAFRAATLYVRVMDGVPAARTWDDTGEQWILACTSEQEYDRQEPHGSDCRQINGGQLIDDVLARVGETVTGVYVNAAGEQAMPFPTADLLSRSAALRDGDITSVQSPGGHA